MSQQKNDMADVRRSLETEKEAEQHEITGNDKLADHLDDRNGTALREAETQRKLKEEADLMKRRPKVTSNLSVTVEGWPFQRHRLGSRTFNSNPEKLLGIVRLLRAEAPLPLGTQGALLFAPAACRKQSLQHFL